MFINFRIKEHVFVLGSVRSDLNLFESPYWLVLGKVLSFAELVSFLDNVYKIFAPRDFSEN